MAYVLQPQHIRGERNAWCDALSRLAQPGSGARVPPPLAGLPRTAAPPRGPTDWVTLDLQEGEYPKEAAGDKDAPEGPGISDEEPQPAA